MQNNPIMIKAHFNVFIHTTYYYIINNEPKNTIYTIRATME